MVAALAGCAGGSGTVAGANNQSTCTGSGTNTVCLDGCSLGCSGVTCAITDIAQNENIVLRFSQPMDPNFVNEATIQLRTATGDVPVGDFLVNGQIVEFVPRVLTIGSQSFFGFRSGETYTMTLPGGIGEPNSVRSTSGDPLNQTISCTLRVSRGIVDLNGVPPSARLITPTAFLNVAQDSVIQLGFNELIDTAPFAQGGSPVSFQVARTTDIGGGVRVCAQEFTPIAGSTDLALLPALPNGIGALLTFTPSSPLPGSSCVRISVTDQVKDLSGRAASPQTFEFQTVVTASTQRDIVEEFDVDDQLDVDISSGAWTGGVATFASIGGDGRHGSFLLTNPNLEPGLVTSNVGPGGVVTYTLNTDNALIPASQTLTGTQAVVADGRFFFTEMIVPANTRLVFTGSRPPVFTVRGRIQIDGEVDLRGESTVWTTDNPPQVGTTPVSSPAYAGQTGGAGGIFGGRGGNGGRRCSGLGATGVESGANGQDCSVLAGHAFAGQVVGTGGRGASLFPAHGLATSLFWPAGTGTAYSLEAAAGGGGGGHFAAGGAGAVVSNAANNPALMGPPSAGGVAFPLLPVPAGQASSLHFLVGGSGGGGGASQPTLVLKEPISTLYAWGKGLGGGGGGGAIALRSGRVIRMASTGKVLASGGSCGRSPTSNSAFAMPGPAGGGSGGSILLQSADSVQLFGELNVQGGARGVLSASSPATTLPPRGGTVVTQGGDGASGLVRLERVGASTGDLATAVGQTSVAPLAETDSRVAFQSHFYSTGQPFAPEYVRYEIQATIDGVPFTFSDDPAIGTPARAGFGPLEAFWQGVRMDLASGQIDPFDQRPWRSFVGGASGLGIDSRNAFRFLLILDRSAGQSVQIESVKVVIRF